MHRAALAILVASLLLSACGFSPFGCTDAGCESGVHFTLDHDLLAETEYRVVACVDDRCAERSLEVPPPDDGPFSGISDGPLSLFIDTDSVFYSLEQLRLSSTHRVSLTIHGADGELLAEWEGTPEFQRMQPNGPLCEPTCWLAEGARLGVSGPDEPSSGVRCIGRPAPVGLLLASHGHHMGPRRA